MFRPPPRLAGCRIWLPGNRRVSRMANRMRSSPTSHDISSVVADEVSTRPKSGQVLLVTRRCWLEWNAAGDAARRGLVGVVFMGLKSVFPPDFCMYAAVRESRTSTERILYAA